MLAATPASAGYLLWLLRTGRARTRADLQRMTGLSRSTLIQRLDVLRAAGYLALSGMNEASRGRPPELLQFNVQHGVVLVADLGADQGRAAVVDVGGRVLAEDTAMVRIDAGPRHVLGWVTGRFEQLLAGAGWKPGQVRGIGVGVPGPVQFDAGLVRQPPIMPGWDAYPIAEHLRTIWECPVYVDNDANLAALGEQVVNHPDCQALVLVKAGSDIGLGIVLNGRVYRGTDGGAGDIGHIRLRAHPNARCECGSYGCLAAVASGAALARRLTALGTPTRSGPELVDRIRTGHTDAVHLARDAGRMVGEVLATVVCAVNPGVLLIEGELAQTHFVTGVREVLYQTALPRATRHLDVGTSQLGTQAAVLGAHAMVLEQVYAPDAVDAQLAGGPA